MLRPHRANHLDFSDCSNRPNLDHFTGQCGHAFTGLLRREGTFLEEIRCEAREGVGTAVAQMREGADMMRFLNDVKSDVDAIDDVADAVGRRSISTTAGRLEGPQEELLLRFDDECQSVAELRDLVVISGASGAAIRLGEIASISNRFEDPEEQVRFNGERAAILDVAKTRDQDILEVLAAVESFVSTEQASSPRASGSP